LNTPDYLDLVRKKLSLPSDYALQKPLGLSKTQLSNYRNGRDSLSDAVALRVAEICEIDAAKVLLDAHIERSKTPEIRAAWVAMMDKLSASFTDLLLALVCAKSMELRADR
jgi:hypothetical protein